MVIRFFSKSATHGEFSNFAPFAIELDGEVWPTSEHYYQAQKFVDPDLQARVRSAAKPIVAKSLANTHRDKIRGDWDTVKDDVMERVVRQKFQSYPQLRDLLLATGDEEIVEAAAHDGYWGEGPDGKGLNKLGMILMRIRDELRSTASESR
jgi:ribA/ribD-fused uncharacterized protein